MSNDVIRGTFISAVGVGLYGLYYAWKVNRNHEFLLSETKVELSEEEKMCISMMLSSDLKNKLLDNLFVLMRDEMGFRIDSQEISSVDAALFRYDISLLDFRNYLQNVKDFYVRYRQDDPATYQEFLTQWLKLFPLSDDSEEEKTLLPFLLEKVRVALRERIDIFLQLNYASNEILRKKDESAFINFLKEKKCINIDTIANDSEFFKNTLWIKRLSMFSADTQ